MGNCVGGKGKKDPTILTEEEIKLLLENTKLNRAQINALHQNFLKECPSGKLTKKDFVKLFKEVHPSENKKEKADKFCEYVFKVIDRDSLGYISFNDFVLCFSLTSYGDFKQKCEFAFRLYDLDKDNKISKKEMTQVLVALYDLSGITDRKKDKAPAKKVDEIMKLINHQTEQKEKANAEAAGENAEAAQEDTKGKKSKKAKKPKAKDFITREQFIDACSEDEALKKLFVDSIFAATAADVTLESPKEVDVTPASVARIDLNSFALDAPEAAAFEVTTTTKVECEVTSDAPAVEAQEASAEVSAAVVDVEVPAVVACELAPEPEAAPEEPVIEVKSETTEVTVEASEVKVEVSAPVVETVVTEEVKSDEKTVESYSTTTFNESQTKTASINVRLSKSKRNF